MDFESTQLKWTDHILEVSKALPSVFCLELIDWFEYKISSGGSKIHSSCEGDNDQWLNGKKFSSYTDKFGPIVDKQLQKIYELYTEEILFRPNINFKETLAFHKLQKHSPEGGFRKWHCENPLNVSNQLFRHTVWMYYLNTVENGGTNFYKPNRTIESAEGKLVLFPAHHTHIHQTQIGYTKNKYIITGWFVSNKI